MIQTVQHWEKKHATEHDVGDITGQHQVPGCSQLGPNGAISNTLKPLSRTNSVVEPELAGEVNAGKSHQLAFRLWKT